MPGQERGRSRRRSDFSPPRQVRLRDDGGAPVPPPADPHVEDGVRLQKLLAQAGLGSRRFCEVLIAQGRVTVDGVVVEGQGMRVDPRRSIVHVDGRRVRTGDSADTVTFALNKPRHVVSAMEDPQGRRTLADFVVGVPQRVYHVGRLDYETEGLLLLSNDGELAHRLTHPSFEVSKTYVVTVDCEGELPRGVLRRLREGVELDDGPIAADAAALLASDGRQAMVEVRLHSGRNRIVRRMFDAVGYPVDRLVRTRIGPIVLGAQRPGELRELTGDELGTLMAQVGL